MTAAPKLRFISVEEYLASELVSKVKHEYLDGRTYAMAGARNVHNDIAGSFFGVMFGKLHASQCRPFNSDTKVRIQLSNDTRFYYPDGMIVCQSNPGSDSFQDRPVILLEVSSPSTRRLDETEKLDAYIKIPSVMTYLVADSTHRRVVAYQREAEGFVAREYTSPYDVISLQAVQSEISVAELYSQADLTSDD